jgi:signal recognition particle subunit SRP68
MLRYRGYCARRIARVRKSTKLVQGEKKKFIKKEVDVDNIAKDSKTLQIPLMSTERAWAYAMQLKFEMNTEPRKKYHMVNRLRKAAKEAEKLDALVAEAGERCDARTKLETKAYAAWIKGTLLFELQQWKEAAADLTAARAIYEKLASALSNKFTAV